MCLGKLALALPMVLSVSKKDQAQIRFQWKARSLQQHLTVLDRAWQAVVGKAMREVYPFELEMYLAKVEAEAIERELKEALKQQEELQKKKKKKAKAQRESLARLAIQDPGQWKVRSEAE